MDFSSITGSTSFLLQGAAYTFELTATSAIGAIILGTFLALGKMAKSRVLSLLCSGYINLMRAVPLVLILFWFFFLVPVFIAWFTGSPIPVPVGPEKTALITFILFEAAYYAEIIRAGIQSISRGQLYASSALGLSFGQMMRYVILPQAFRNMGPVLLTQTIVLFQDTSLVYVLSATDFMGAVSKIAQRDSQLTLMYCFAAVCYFVVSFTLSTGVKQMQKKLAIIR